MALRRANIAIANREIHRRIGMSGGSLVRQLVREQTKQHRALPVRQLEQWHDAAFTKATRDVHLLPGVEELLRHLNQTAVRWAIATTGGRKQTRRLLRALTIQPQTVVTGDDVEKAKPSPDVFVLAAHRLSVPIDQCIVVGDSVWDMLAAGRALTKAERMESNQLSPQSNPGAQSKQDLRESCPKRLCGPSVHDPTPGRRQPRPERPLVLCRRELRGQPSLRPYRVKVAHRA